MDSKIIDKITVNCHSSIRIGAEKVIYFDPFKIQENASDADIIFLTHSHFDHFSKEDVAKLIRKDTVLVMPETIRDTVCREFPDHTAVLMKPWEKKEICGIMTEAVPSYNVGKPMHKKEYGWLGYVVTVDSERIYVCGDMDDNEDARRVKCDILLVPAGGTYTMNAAEAAAFADAVGPDIAVPTHYADIVGSLEDGDIFRKNTHCKTVLKIGEEK